MNLNFRSNWSKIYKFLQKQIYKKNILNWSEIGYECLKKNDICFLGWCLAKKKIRYIFYFLKTLKINFRSIWIADQINPKFVLSAYREKKQKLKNIYL